MDCVSIPYTRVPGTSALYLDYLYHFDRLARFFGASPFQLSTYRAVADELQPHGHRRAELAAILTSQNKAFGSGDATFANIDRLSRPGTFAVVTGQQVGLFSGPAFTLYKALTAVKLAQHLSAQGLPSVPVFWLATEDHDLEEVAQTAVFDAEYDLVPLRDEGVRPAPRSPVGHVKFSAEVNATLDRLASALEPGDSRQRVLGDLRQSYTPGATWGAAFGRFAARLFSRWGVVLVDALDESLHRLNARVYEQVLAETAALRARLLERSRELVAAGYHAQVHVAEDSTLLFLSQNGNRGALRQRGDQFVLDSTGGQSTFSLAQLECRAATDPHHFSANALMRPIVQDLLLPTLAYVAGPSELAYHGQSQVLYSAFGRPQPVVFPRAGFTLVDRRVERLLEKYRLNVEDVWQGEERLGRRIAAAGFAVGWAERFDASEKELAGLLARLRKDVETIDPTLLEALRHAEEKMQFQMEKLKGKISRAALERSELLARHKQSLVRYLTPRQDLQERQVSGAYFLARAGYELLDALLGHIPTNSSDHQVLVV